MTYDWEADSKGCYDEAIRAKRAEWLVENIPGVKQARVIGRCELMRGDCFEIMPHLERVDACVTDPPYGIGRANGANGGGVCGKTGKPRNPKSYAGDWDQKPANVSFVPLCSRQAIVWGGQYFSDQLPMGAGWLVWDKQQTMPTYGDGELAWTNLESTTLRKFTYSLNAMISRKETGLHPTQKPVALMEWCLGFLPNADTILDPFMGSGTTLVACAKLGRKGIGIELDPDYFEIACKRVEDAYRQPDLFVEQPKQQPVQEGFDL
jgi:DNA modification methylase